MGLREQLAARDAEIVRLTQSIAEQTSLIAALTRTIAEQTAAIESLRHGLDKRKRKDFGRKSERMPTIREELEARQAALPDPAAKPADKPKRTARAEPLEVLETPVLAPSSRATCGRCGEEASITLPPSPGRRLIEYRPPSFVYEQPMLERRACPCGHHTISATSPEPLAERSPFGPRLVAHLVTTKLLDAVPQYRLSRILKRSGVLLSRQTMNDLFHRAADATKLLSDRLMAIIAEQEIVEADETTQRCQDKRGTNYLWAFRAEVEPGKALVAYCFARSRASDVPARILAADPAQARGRRYLLTDMYSGYGPAARAARRQRAACWAHVRRHFFELKDSHPVVLEVLGLILDLYEVERDAEREGIVGSGAHHGLRRERSLPIVMAIRLWARHQRRGVAPRSPLGKALAYVLGNMPGLTRFLREPRLRLDNNRLENAMRAPAMGRKNWLFVGDGDCGERHACLLTLLQSAVGCGHNPEVYLADVLRRLGTTRQQDLDLLLPHRWRPEPT